MTTKAQALATFKAQIKPHIPKGDKPALCEAWNNYVDSLHRDGMITYRQVNNWVNPF
jgi:hypothetical protein